MAIIAKSILDSHIDMFAPTSGFPGVFVFVQQSLTVVFVASGLLRDSWLGVLYFKEAVL